MCIWLLQRCTGQVQKYWTITSMRLRSQFVRRQAGLSIIWLFWLVCHVLAPIIRGRTRLNFFGDQQSSLQPKLELWPQRLRARCPPSRKACNSIFSKELLEKEVPTCQPRPRAAVRPPSSSPPSPPTPSCSQHPAPVEVEVWNLFTKGKLREKVQMKRIPRVAEYLCFCSSLIMYKWHIFPTVSGSSMFRQSNKGSPCQCQQ